MTDSDAGAPITTEPVPASKVPPAWSRLGSTAWLAIFIGTVVVVATAVILLGGNRPPANYPADSPEGALQRYLVAWYDSDYVTAYDYFSTSVKARMSFSDFTLYANDYGVEQTVTIDRTTGTGTRRTIYLTVEEFYGPDPGGGSYSRDVSITMVQEGGVWKVDEPLSGVDQNYSSF
jgi:hypothetical protein